MKLGNSGSSSRCPIYQLCTIMQVSILSFPDLKFCWDKMFVYVSCSVMSDSLQPHGL